MLLAIWLLLAIQTATAMSVTHDEIWHLPVGVRNLAGDFAADRLNPPLSRMWAALPLRLGGVEVPPANGGGPAIGEAFVASLPGFFNWYIVGRLFHLAWPLATAILLYAWLLQLGGLAVARTGLFVLLCCPDMTAHGALVTPDAPAMFGFLLASWCLWRWLADPCSWRRTLCLGLALGFLQSLKFTGIVFYPIFALLCLGTMLRPNRSDPPRRLWRLWLCGAGVVAISLAVLAAAFGFQGVLQPLASYQFRSTDLKTVQQLFQPIPAFPVPLPRDFLLGLDEQRAIMESPHPVFLDGAWSLKGFRTYYLMTLADKLPHAVQFLSLLGVLGIRRSRHPDWSMLLALWLPVLLLLGIASLSGMQLGQRYILPIVPALAFVAAFSALLLERFELRARQLLTAGAVLLLLAAWRYHPHHLAYFNEWAGGPIGGRWRLIDSNLDWGQDLRRAADFIKAHAARQPRFVYFGTVDPRRVGIASELPPSRHPEPGLHLISVNFVMGRPHSAWQPDGSHRAIDFNEFGYFRFFEPVQTLGGSIDVYDITPEDVARYERAMMGR